MTHIIPFPPRKAVPIKEPSAVRSFLGFRSNSSPEKTIETIKSRQSILLASWIEDSVATAGAEWTLRSLEEAARDLACAASGGGS